MSNFDHKRFDVACHVRVSQVDSESPDSESTNQSNTSPPRRDFHDDVVKAPLVNRATPERREVLSKVDSQTTQQNVERVDPAGTLAFRESRGASTSSGIGITRLRSTSSVSSSNDVVVETNGQEESYNNGYNKINFFHYII